MKLQTEVPKMKGYWIKDECLNWKPEVRESLTMVLDPLNYKYLYIYGGVGAKLLNDFLIYDISK